ncbi:MAG: hypothetical protein GQ574_21535 [Crocinitomix sp.]|nr:hypothetical protein [Crocinitomix sp.]
MKKYSLLIVLLFALITPSCNSELTRENLIGTWNVIEFTSNANLSSSVIASGREVAITSSYKFAEDGTIQYDDDYIEQPLNSKWELDSEKREITFTSGNDHQSFEILSYTKNEMVWSESMGELGTNRYTLTKVD